MIKRFFFGVVSVLLSPIVMSTEIIPARMVAHYWVEGSVGLSMSGLSFCDGSLLTVSDRKPEEIYTIKFEDKSAKTEPYLSLSGLKAPKRDKPKSFWYLILDLFELPVAMEFEGISCTDNAIYVLSERYNRIAVVDMQGRVRWLKYAWSLMAKAQGYLKGFNLGSVGLVKVGDDFWVALESEPRGLVKLSQNGKAQIFSLPPVAGLDFRGELENLAGLDYYDGALFTLEPNAHAVCRRALPSLKAEWCLDYRAFEKSPEMEYAEADKGGKGGGLAIGEQGIFIVFDNNDLGRGRDQEDRRGLLLQLAFPEGAQ